MYELFLDLVGDIPYFNDDLMVVLSALFFLFLLTEICRVFGIVIDYIFKRKS